MVEEQIKCNKMKHCFVAFLHCDPNDYLSFGLSFPSQSIFSSDTFIRKRVGGFHGVRVGLVRNWSCKWVETGRKWVSHLSLSKENTQIIIINLLKKQWVIQRLNLQVMFRFVVVVFRVIQGIFPSMYVMNVWSYAVQSHEHAYFQPYFIWTNSHPRSQQEKKHLASVGQLSQERPALSHVYISIWSIFLQ